MLKKHLRSRSFKMAALTVAGSLIGWGVVSHLDAASDSASALQVVIADIAIAQVSDLDFGADVAGASSKAVAAGSSENSENASFAITGAANYAYTVTLPSNGTVTMITGGGGANQTIAVNSFTSNTASGSNNLGAGGAQTLFVGATRAALGASQVVGSYTATFNVSVVY